MTRWAPLLLGLVACADDPTRASFAENVGQAFEACNPAEIRFLSAKHNFMTAFEPCGSNNFADLAWSPTGTHVYFQLTLAGHVMNADAPDKRTITLPTTSPVGPAVWVNASRVAVPVGPSEEGGELRLALFDVGDMETTGLNYLSLGALREPRDLQRADRGDAILLTALEGDTRRLFRVDLRAGTVAPASPWVAALDKPLTSFTHVPALDRAVLGHGDEVTLYVASTGEALQTWSDATRGILHPEGRWLTLESDGEPISIFFQRTWDELSEPVRERELRRLAAFEERLPEQYPRRVEPPTLSIVDLQTTQRWRITSVLGHDFEWYEALPPYASLILWGYEGKQLNANVLLGSFAERIKSIERNEEMIGVERWESAPSVGDAPREGSAD